MPVSVRTIMRSSHTPVVLLALLGTLSSFLYMRLALAYPLADFVRRFPLTDLGRVNNYSAQSLVDFLFSILGALVLYLLAYRVVRRYPSDRRLLWWVLGYSALFSAILLSMYPIAATDIFEYVFHSRILVHYGQNPLAVPPVMFQGDPFLKTVNWAAHPSPYGPLWVILTVPATAVAGNDLVAGLITMKGEALLFHIGCALLVAAILRDKNPAYKVGGTLLYAWNPLVLFEAPGNGHNGIIMMFFALGAIYLLVKRKWLWVVPALIASVLIKYITAILLIPFLLYCWRAQEADRRVAFLVRTSLVSLLLIAILMLPFLDVPRGLLEEANFYSLLAIPTLGYNWLKGLHGDKMAKVITIAISVTSYLVLYLSSIVVLGRELRPRRLIGLSAWLTIAYLGVACMHFQPWFTIWPIALGIWIDHPTMRRVLVVFTISALLSYAANYFWVWNIRAWQTIQVNLMFVAVIFVPPLVVGLVSRDWSVPLARLQAAWRARPAL